MNKFLSLAMAMAMMVTVLAGCAKEPAVVAKTPEELTELYTQAIEDSRPAEENEYFNIVSSTEDDMAQMFLDTMGLTAEDMSAFAITTTPMNIRAYGVALVMPAEGKEDAVKEALQAFIDGKQASFQTYLVDQYEVAKAAKLETLADGTIVMVMTDGQDEVLSSMKTIVEGE